MKPGVYLAKAAALALAALLASACQEPVCPEGSVTYLNAPADFPALVEPPAASPLTLEIGGRLVQVDRVIEGPLCNDVWSGTVYVGCNVQVAAWEAGEPPTFFKGCDLTVAPGATVYVAAHNDTPYINGCSCHTGQLGR